MKKRNRMLALLLAAAMGVSLVACGKGSQDQAAANTPDSSVSEAGGEGEAVNTSESEENVDPLAAAEEKLVAVTSVNAKSVMEMGMNMSDGTNEQSMEVITTMDMTIFSEPLRMKLDITTGAGTQGEISQSIYVDTAEDNTTTMYMFDGTSWQSQQVDPADLGQYNALVSIEGFVDDTVGFQEDGIEQVDGKDAYKYSAKLTGDALKEQMLSSGALDSMSSMGFDESQMETMMDDLDEMPVALWIDKETLYPVKYEVDMTAAMDTLMSNMLEAMGDQAAGMSMGMDKMNAVTTFSNYNAATEFTVPAEAMGE